MTDINPDLPVVGHSKDTWGATLNVAVGAAVAQANAAVAGLVNKVDTDDSRLSDARTPVAHDQAADTITGLGDAAVKNTGTVAGTLAAGDDSRFTDARTPTTHSQAASTISDSTVVGRAVLTATDAAAARTAVGAGTSSLALGTTTGTALDAAAASATYAPFVGPGGWSPSGPGQRRVLENVEFAQSGQSSYGETDGCCRFIFKPTMNTKRWRLRFTNANNSGKIVYPGAIDFNGLWIGPMAIGSDGDLDTSGAFIGTPTQALAPFTTPTDGSEFVSAWVTDPAAQLPSDHISLLSFGYSMASTQMVGSGQSRWFFSNGGGITAKGQAGATTVTAMGHYAQPYWDIRIEYDFAGPNPIGLVLGDSLSAPLNSVGNGMVSYEAWHQLAASRARIPVMGSGQAGASINILSDPTSFVVSRAIGLGINYDFVVLEFGSNDVAAGTPLAVIQPFYATAVSWLKNTVGIKNVLLTTIAPRGLATTPESNRVALNAWLRAAPYGCPLAVDFDRILADPADPTNLRAEYKTPDGVHWTVSGHGAAAAATSYPVA